MFEALLEGKWLIRSTNEQGSGQGKLPLSIYGRSEEGTRRTKGFTIKYLKQTVYMYVFEI